MSNFIQILFSSLESGCVYALATLGIIIIFRTSRVTNYAQGTIGMFGAFAATSFLVSTGANEFVAAFVGMITAFLLGTCINFVIIRPAKNASPVSKQILTFGVIMLVLGVAPMLFGSVPLQFGKFIKTGEFTLLGASLTYNAMFNIVVGIGLMVILFSFLQYSKWGLAVRATATSEQTAELMGIPTELVNMGAWAIASMLSTLAAIMVAPATTVTVGLMDTVQIFALIALVLGGFQTFHGPVIAAYLIAFAKNLISFYISSTWSLAILYIAILLTIVILPNGLFGKKVVKKV
ncbi:MAG: branched-chain amino acid ABC transporter permease [Lachnospirales bacterium]